jgi:hypothetical protein
VGHHHGNIIDKNVQKGLIQEGMERYKELHSSDVFGGPCGVSRPPARGAKINMKNSLFHESVAKCNIQWYALLVGRTY